MFTEDLPEVETLPRDRVLGFLREGFQELAIPYLEHILHEWQEKGPHFHNVLVQLYLERVQGLMKQYLNSLPEGRSPGPRPRPHSPHADRTLEELTANGSS